MVVRNWDGLVLVFRHVADVSRRSGDCSPAKNTMSRS